MPRLSGWRNVSRSGCAACRRRDWWRKRHGKDHKILQRRVERFDATLHDVQMHFLGAERNYRTAGRGAGTHDQGRSNAAADEEGD